MATAAHGHKARTRPSKALRAPFRALGPIRHSSCTPAAGLLAAQGFNGIAAGGGAAGDEARHNGKDNADEDEPQRR